jgi:bifunctional UDP-N-acetylglucosamine pyrophosphorylase/glucosamine-1-phosphate N-acetyltransferase
VAVVVLAAGKGKRLHSTKPKILHEVCGRPSLWHVLQAARAARPSLLAVVVGSGKDDVIEAVRSWDLQPEPVFVDQGTPLGTGHAVMAAEDATRGADDVLVLNGDDPLITGLHVRRVLGLHRRSRSAATIVTTELDDPSGYGRVIREGSEFVRIVEEADATPEIKAIREVSTIVYAFRREDLLEALPLVGRDNKQNEYYLPDVLKILKEKGRKVSALPIDLGGGLGFNSRERLAQVTRIMRRRIVGDHMAKGVTFVDPDTSYVDVEVRIGQDTVIQPMSFLQGRTRIGSRCTIGPGSRVQDSTIGDECEVAFSVVRGSKIGARVNVGPYASIRPDTVIEEGGKAGTFVEIKASHVGKRSKVPHLSYVGDASLGEDVNLGAGTVTVNYDGFTKHRTVVGDGARVGSDTMLVAPVKVGKHAWTGAGSAITRDIPDGALAVERNEQRIVPGYDERKRAAQAAKAKSGGQADGARRGGRRRD